MELEKIDVVGAKRPQARLERAHQLGPRSPVLDDPGAKLRGEHHLVPPSAQGRPDVLLGASLAVGTGRVEKGDTDIECRAHDLGGLSLVEAPPEVVAPEPCERDSESRCAQSSLFHLPSACSLTVRCPAEPSDHTRRLALTRGEQGAQLEGGMEFLGAIAENEVTRILHPLDNTKSEPGIADPRPEQRADRAVPHSLSMAD